MSLWGPLEDRYADPDRPHKLLALDGGGIRGVLTLEILAEIERQLKEMTGSGEDFRLCRFFDYIGGTSTGAIIAAGLARGMSVSEIRGFYHTLGPKIFTKSSWLKRCKSFFKKGPLTQELKQAFGEDTDLSPESLECLFLAVTRDVTTDSPWPISSNPYAIYNDPHRSDCNLNIPLWKIVRASTAAPIFFPREVIAWDPEDPRKTFVFMDGAITPYNNPAFLLYRMASHPSYRLGWPTGEHKMMIVAAGTGAAPTLNPDVRSPDENLVNNLIGLPGALMYGAEVDQDINCRLVGRCVSGAPIDRELGDMIPPEPLDQDLGRAFLYARYNADLSPKGLEELGLGSIDSKKITRLDAVDQVDALANVGREVARREVRMERFRRFI